MLTEGKGALIPSIADNTVKRFKSSRKQSKKNTRCIKEKENDEKPEIAGVSIPSPINMHVPNIAMNSSTLLATMLLSKKIPSLLLFPVLPSKTE